LAKTVFPSRPIVRIARLALLPPLPLGPVAEHAARPRVAVTAAAMHAAFALLSFTDVPSLKFVTGSAVRRPRGGPQGLLVRELRRSFVLTILATPPGVVKTLGGLKTAYKQVVWNCVPTWRGALRGQAHGSSIALI